MDAPEGQVEFAAHEELVLRICAAPDADHAASMALLEAEEWDVLAAIAEDKRLSALVLRAVDKAQAAAMLPPAAFARLSGASQWHALYVLKQMAAVKRLIRILAAQGFDPILLKGFALAHAVYPDRTLRPLRDVDLLLPTEQAQQAQDFLIANPHYRIAPWAGSYGLEFGHQLPEIQDVDHDLTIEIHHRLNARNWEEEPLLLAQIRAEPTSLTMMGLNVRIPSARTNFLHLLEHATLHHAFENGPLVLADFHFLARHVADEWPWIEAQCDRMGLARALRLVATVADDLGADWVPAHLVDRSQVGASHIATAKAAMLQDREKSERNKLLRRLEAEGQGRKGWRAALARALRPNPYQLAKIAGCRPDQARRWLHYPVWLIQSGRRFLAASSNSDSLLAAQREAGMVQWLAGAEAPRN
ncbi:nucleotidyltransferase domain-containing protein [Novosphingobium jiangmenense]|uniref:Nucleotidyltransferase family protein n=1 Tax=Novosphingobium jiangmenense TaxID=2791981 RepID=A0ABS0HL95_9SPHN|nr:nucleotidyltransferase family protein [Novosphingobium jiangmenense]MBF9153030.1 nucleotidyltransferase family protein [Novosphingobium jiangmenense]